jgi:broad specificity phosphatase PhoE
MDITIDFKPDLIVVSPMRRTIQTAFTAFPTAVKHTCDEERIPVEVWPELREAHDAICNRGSPTEILVEEFPDLDFSECMAEWTYETHTHERAVKRAEVVRQRLMNHPAQNIVCITHRGFIAHLVESHIFAHCGTFKSLVLSVMLMFLEIGLFNFVDPEVAESRRFAPDPDGVLTDYGPSMLLRI